MITKRTKMTLLSSAVVLALSACSGSKDDKAPTADNVTLNNVKHWLSVPVHLAASDPNGDPMTVTFSENGTPVNEVNGVYQFSHGTLTRTNDLSFSYTSLTGEPATIDYEVNANGKTAAAQIIINEVTGDPLANQQWHLRNTGQKAYALSDEMKAGLVDFYVANFGFTPEDAQALMDAEFEAAESLLVPGEDINVVEAYQQGVTGEGAYIDSSINSILLC